MNNIVSRLYFASDYMEGAHPAIMQKLVETNLEDCRIWVGSLYRECEREDQNSL